MSVIERYPIAVHFERNIVYPIKHVDPKFVRERFKPTTNGPFETGPAKKPIANQRQI